MRDHDGILSFTPRLPQALTRLAFRLCFRGRRLLVEVGHEQATYSLLQGDSLEIVHHGEKATVDATTAADPPDPSAAPARDPQPAARARTGAARGAVINPYASIDSSAIRIGTPLAACLK